MYIDEGQEYPTSFMMIIPIMTTVYEGGHLDCGSKCGFWWWFFRWGQQFMVKYIDCSGKYYYIVNVVFDVN